MRERGSLEGSLKGQHNAMLRDLNRMRRLAYTLAERTVADAWEGEAIDFAHWVMRVMDDLYYRCERLEDQGQIRLHE